MEIFGGFMVMMSIISLFLAVVWLIMPFVVFAIKGKQDRTLEVLEAIEKRLAVIEAALPPVGNVTKPEGPVGHVDSPAVSAAPSLDQEKRTEPVTDKNGSEASPAVSIPGGL